MKILCIIGTRPEVIKMAPIIWQLKKLNNIELVILNSAQHRELIDDLLVLFKIEPDIDLNIMQENQSLAVLTGNLFLKMSGIIQKNAYDFIFIQGDTTTALVAAEVAFYNKIPFAHVEAGLRTFDFHNPFPEEMNRVFISQLASLHFAPTLIEEEILLKENIKKENIFVTGNTVIDSLYYWAKKKLPLPFPINKNKKIILLTLHRRESFGKHLYDMFSAFLELTKLFTDIHIVFPVHPNPNVKKLAYEMLNHHAAITLLPPQQYDVFVSLIQHAYLVCTDSGGLQEEAPALNKPLLILRAETERPLIVNLGLAKLTGTNKSAIIAAVSNLLKNENLYKSMQKNISPYGDGFAAERIVKIVLNQYHLTLQNAPNKVSSTE